MRKLKSFLGPIRFIHIILLVMIFTTNLMLLAYFSIKIFRQDSQKIEYISLLEEELAASNGQIALYEKLFDHINNIAFDTLYYGYGSTEGGRGHSFTAFSLFYKGQYYLITAGHNVEKDGFRYNDFIFKASGKNRTLKPELILYENDYENKKDYAVFYDSRILSGLKPATHDLTPAYTAGSAKNKINIIKKYDTGLHAIAGESGSPILNQDCRVIGVLIKSGMEYTDISIVTNALDMLAN